MKLIANIITKTFTESIHTGIRFTVYRLQRIYLQRNRELYFMSNVFVFVFYNTLLSFTQLLIMIKEQEWTVNIILWSFCYKSLLFLWSYQSQLFKGDFHFLQSINRSSPQKVQLWIECMITHADNVIFLSNNVIYVT